MNLYLNKKYCNNCGKYGHIYSKCNESIISLGIIAIKVNEDFYKYIKKNINIKNINLEKINSYNNSILLNLLKYKKCIKFLMIRRKNTLGYLEFLRGHYDMTNINDIIDLFNLMTPGEVNDILNNNFLNLWTNLWSTDKKKNKYYNLEFEKSEEKFNYLIKNNLLNQVIKTCNPKFNFPEWGFPKGRRNYMEKNISCAIREFKEETGLEGDDFIFLNNINLNEEQFVGSNNIKYKHLYYLGICNEDINVEIKKDSQKQEIGDIGWFNYDECVKLLRSFRISRLNILNNIFIFISNILNKNILLENYLIKNEDIIS